MALSEDWEAFERRCKRDCLSSVTCAGIALDRASMVCRMHAWPPRSPFSQVAPNILVRLDADAPTSDAVRPPDVTRPCTPEGFHEGQQAIAVDRKPAEAVEIASLIGERLDNETNRSRPLPSPRGSGSRSGVFAGTQLVALGGAVGVLFSLSFACVRAATHRRWHLHKVVTATDQTQPGAQVLQRGEAARAVSGMVRHVDSALSLRGIFSGVSFSTHHTAAAI